VGYYVSALPAGAIVDRVRPVLQVGAFRISPSNLRAILGAQSIAANCVDASPPEDDQRWLEVRLPSPVPAYPRPRTNRVGRAIVSAAFPAALAATLAHPATAFAQTAVTLPAPPFSLPFLPSLASDWTVRLGGDGGMAPDFVGSKNLMFSPKLIFSVQRAGSPEHFRGALDNPSIALIDYGQFRAGPVAKLDTGRAESVDKALKGLGGVGATIELGAFVEYFPVDWFRTRVEVRNGFGAQRGIFGDLSADAILPLTERITLSGGPRFSFTNAQAISPLFGINEAQSLASGLPTYHVSGGSYSTGVGGQIGYRLTSQWEVHGYVEYDRLLGSAAASPLVKLRGSPDQLMVRLGLSYSFDVKVR
jgi:outer membrane protein